MSYTKFDELLRANGTSVYRVSKATGISASTFTDWKNGRSVPKADKMRKIADFFGVTLDALLGSENQSAAIAGYTSARSRKNPAFVWSAVCATRSCSKIST